MSSGLTLSIDQLFSAQSKDSDYQTLLFDLFFRDSWFLLLRLHHLHSIQHKQFDILVDRRVIGT